MSVWDSLVGQSAVVEELKRAATSGSPSHAWLITGPPGSGRSVAARCLAAALECTGAEPGCGQCEGCRTVMAGTHLDVTALATDKVEIVKDEIDPLLQTAQMSPIAGDYRIIIVEDADRIRDLNGNRLLKAIEEPPARTVWILCAPTPEDLLVTIRSRCRQVRLGTPAPEDVAALLASEEQVPYEQALNAARICQSHVGLARAMLRDPSNRERRVELIRVAISPENTGQAVAAAAQLMAEAKTIAEKTSADLDGRERATLLDSYGVTDDQVLPKDVAASLRALEAEQKRRSRRSLADALDRLCLDLLSFFRDVMVRQASTAVTIVNADLQQDIDQWANTQVAPIIESIELARDRLLTNAVPQLVMEALLISISQDRN